jgi:hypothetical protein
MKLMRMFMRMLLKTKKEQGEEDSLDIGGTHTKLVEVAGEQVR